MKKFEVIYKHGQFLDKNSGKRLIPIQDREYLIIGDDNSFDIDDFRLHLEDPFNEKEKANWIQKEYGAGNHIKILKADDKLFFRLGNSKRIKGDESKVFYFVCNLLEDLYIYKLKYREGSNELDWRLADCQCELIGCDYGGLKLSESLRSESLNKLFCNTVMYYFPLQRSGSINVFKTFFLYPGQNILRFPGIPERQYSNLDSIRHKVVSLLK